MYHYTSSGLSNVWLLNGYTEKRTAYGKAVSILHLEALHRSIGERLAKTRPFLTGPEFRFLRKELEMSQAKLGTLMGVEAQTVALWEKRGRIPKMPDRLIRSIYLEATSGNAKIIDLINTLNAMEQREKEKLYFEETRRGWQPKMAA